MRVGILLTCRKHLDDLIISLGGDVIVHKTSLFQSFFFIKLPVASQGSKRSCTCVLGTSILPLSTIFIFDFGIVPTVWYFGIVPTVWYFGIVPTVWYFRIVPIVWYFRIVPTVWYFMNCSDSVIF